jgi:hypothetical protein
MRRGEERDRSQLGDVERAEPELVTKLPHAESRFSADGPLPEVAEAQAITTPSPSERAYDEVRPAAPETWPQVLRDFYWKFPAAARLIAAQPSSCKFVKECEAKGAKFGGYAEDGPGHTAWPYTAGTDVYIPKADGDGLKPMSSFLFELNNAVRHPAFEGLRQEALKGKRGTLDAKSFARKKVALEVEGMLKLGEIWIQMKKEAHKETDADWAAHDSEFYLQIYQDHRAGKLSKDDIIERVLKSVYSKGAHAGKTVEEFYSGQYNSMQLMELD